MLGFCLPSVQTYSESDDASSPTTTRQRVVIARALASRPPLIVADEPVSMPDVSLRAGILTLVRELRETHGLPQSVTRRN